MSGYIASALLAMCAAVSFILAGAAVVDRDRAPRGMGVSSIIVGIALVAAAIMVRP
jgi:hypothetical protein